MTTALQEILANTPRLEQPPVDPRIPLAGFTFNPASQLFEDSSTGYVFDPAKNVFTNLRTRHEYTYDTESRLFRPRAAALQADAVSLKGIVSGIKLPDFSPGLKQELESGTEAFNSFLSQLSSRFTPRKSYEPPAAPAVDPPPPDAVPGTPLHNASRAARSAARTAAAVVAAARSVGSPAARDAALRDAHEQARSRGGVEDAIADAQRTAREMTARAESARAELAQEGLLRAAAEAEAAEVTEQLTQRHAQELIAVRAGWRERCEALERTVRELRDEKAAAAAAAEPGRLRRRLRRRRRRPRRRRPRLAARGRRRSRSTSRSACCAAPSPRATTRRRRRGARRRSGRSGARRRRRGRRRRRRRRRRCARRSRRRGSGPRSRRGRALRRRRRRRGARRSEEVVAAAAARDGAEARAAELEMERDGLLGRLSDALPQLLEQLGGLGDAAAAAAPARAAAADTLATSAAADTLVAAEGQRHAERIRRLEFENEELRRATKTKTERINALRRQIAERDAASMLSVSTS